MELSAMAKSMATVMRLLDFVVFLRIALDAIISTMTAIMRHERRIYFVLQTSTRLASSISEWGL